MKLLTLGAGRLWVLTSPWGLLSIMRLESQKIIVQCCKIQAPSLSNDVHHRDFDFILFYFILLASPTGRDTATACANYCGSGTRSQFCGGRKPECPDAFDADEQTNDTRWLEISKGQTYYRQQITNFLSQCELVCLQVHLLRSSKAVSSLSFSSAGKGQFLTGIF